TLGIPGNARQSIPLRDRSSYRSQAPVVFFSQAEDGIRGGHVTGVQTCALPICPRRAAASEAAAARRGRGPGAARASRLRRAGRRSEERRVGKECRSVWLTKHYKKKRTHSDHKSQ